MMEQKKAGLPLKIASISLTVVLIGGGVWFGLTRREPVSLRKAVAQITPSPETTEAEQPALTTKDIAVSTAESLAPPPIAPEEDMEAQVLRDKQELPLDFIWPTTGGNVSAGLLAYPGHLGIDIAGNGGVGAPVYAAAAGTVVSAVNGVTGYGKYIVLEHGDMLYTMYAHCDSLAVKVGDMVEQGQEIATLGRTGRVTGPCLHFEIRQGTYFLDPAQYIAP